MPDSSTEFSTAKGAANPAEGTGEQASFHSCGRVCGTRQSPAQASLLHRQSTLLDSRTRSWLKGASRRIGTPGRADRRKPVERSSESAQGGAERNDLPDLVR